MARDTSHDACENPRVSPETLEARLALERALADLEQAIKEANAFLPPWRRV